MTPPRPNVLEQLCSRLGISGNQTVVASLDGLLRRTRRELYECARELGLTRLSRLGKEALAGRVLAALNRGAGADDRPASDPEHIPWGYGVDRVTAMVVDPERLYVYWELTDDAIERARGTLGAGGPDASLCLRVYDVTGRIFDGGNAHSYFDHVMSRHDRQWFFFIGKPASTTIVELGVRSNEGIFVRVARSGRADFPRREPVPPGGMEWLTVTAAVGEVHRSFAAPHPRLAPPRATEPPMAVGAMRVWDIRRTHAVHEGEWIRVDESFGSEWTAFEWGDRWNVEWEGDVVSTSWEAGPYSYPIAPPAYVEERLAGGMVVRSVGGTKHVTFGPWQVIIRGIAARAARKVFGVWEIRRSWVTQAGVAAPRATATPRRAGASERIGGASELRWLTGSEVRLRGASEVFMLGASELRHRGASETLYAGASEARLRGASEQRFRGASEWRHVGASEHQHLGGSEQRRRPTYPDER